MTTVWVGQFTFNGDVGRSAGGALDLKRRKVLYKSFFFAVLFFVPICYSSPKRYFEEAFNEMRKLNLNICLNVVRFVSHQPVFFRINDLQQIRLFCHGNRFEFVASEQARKWTMFLQR